MTDPLELNAAPAARRSESLRELINDLIARPAAGETVTDESIIEQRPELMTELADELRNLQLVERAEQDAQSDPVGLKIRCPHCHEPMEVGDDRSLSDLLCPSCGSQFGLTDDSDRTFRAGEQEMVNQFQLLEQ